MLDYFPLGKPNEPIEVTPLPPPNPNPHSSVITSIVSNVTTDGKTTALNTTTGDLLSDINNQSPPLAAAAAADSQSNGTDDNNAVHSQMFLKMKFKVKDKNARDMFMVSKYLQGSVRGALGGFWGEAPLFK